MLHGLCKIIFAQEAMLLLKCAGTMLIFISGEKKKKLVLLLDSSVKWYLASTLPLAGTPQSEKIQDSTTFLRPKNILPAYVGLLVMGDALDYPLHTMIIISPGISAVGASHRSRSDISYAELYWVLFCKGNLPKVGGSVCSVLKTAVRCSSFWKDFFFLTGSCW